MSAIVVSGMASHSGATGVNEIITNPPSLFYDNSQVPVTGFLPYNPTSTLVTSMGCKINIAGGNVSASFPGANLLMSCDEVSPYARFIWVMQNNNQNHPRTLFEVRHDGMTRVNGMLVIPSDSGNPNWAPRIPYGGVGGQIPTSYMTIIAGDIPDATGSILQVYSTLRDVYQSSNAPALATFFGYVNSNGGNGFQGVKRFEVMDNGATSINGLPVPTLSCVAGGALPATRWYVRYTINMPQESLLSPPFVNIQCAVNQVLRVTSPPASIGMTWNVYVGTGGPATERLQGTGSNLILGTDWTMPVSGLSGTTTAPYYLQNGLLNLVGGYPCTGSPSICATLYIGGPTTGGTKNYAIYAPTGGSFLSGVTLNSFTFATLPADDNGTMRYCADCDPSATLASCASIGAKTGAFAYRVAGAWKCMG
jgi:hypothetical protein